MTIQNILDRVQLQLPHQYPDDLMIQWVNELEKDIVEVLTHYEDTEDLEPVPHTAKTDDILIDEPQIYVPYLIAQVCLANEEYDRYNNHAMVFQSRYQDWKDSHIRTHMPVCKGRVRV